MSFEEFENYLSEKEIIPAKKVEPTEFAKYLSEKEISPDAIEDQKESTVVSESEKRKHKKLWKGSVIEKYINENEGM